MAGRTTKSTKTSGGNGGAPTAARAPKQLAQQPAAASPMPGPSFNKRDVTSLSANFRKATESLEAIRGTLAKAGLELSQPA